MTTSWSALAAFRSVRDESVLQCPAPHLSPGSAGDGGRRHGSRQPRDPYESAAEPGSIDLRECWQIVRRRWSLVLVVTAIGVIGGAGYSVVSSQTYAATSQVVVTGSPRARSTRPLSRTPRQHEHRAGRRPVSRRSPRRRPGSSTSGHGAAAASADRLTVTVRPARDHIRPAADHLEGGVPAARQAGANAFATGYLAYRHGQLAAQVASPQTSYPAGDGAQEEDLAGHHELSGTRVGSAPRASRSG